MHDKAIDSWRRALQLEGPSAEVYIAIAENFLMIEGGVLSVVAMENIRAALRIEPENPVAIYYMGLAEAQSGETDRAIEIWRDLLNNSFIDPNLRALIEDQIEKR
jgi:cytochrome c-type biogenesis protein CcmH